MDKVLIRQHLNTLFLVMNHLQRDIDSITEKIRLFETDANEIISLNHYQHILKEALCDLDTIRQEYQKELDKWPKN